MPAIRSPRRLRGSDPSDGTGPSNHCNKNVTKYLEKEKLSVEYMDPYYHMPNCWIRRGYLPRVNDDNTVQDEQDARNGVHDVLGDGDPVWLLGNFLHHINIQKIIFSPISFTFG